MVGTEIQSDSSNSMKHGLSLKETNLKNVDQFNGDVKVVNLQPQVPDGGYGWVICFAAFVLSGMMDGLMFSFGILLDTLTSELNIARWAVSSIGSLNLGISMCVGPIACGLIHKFGCRPVSASGGVLIGLGLLFSYSTNRFWCLLLSYGILTGIGIGLVYSSTVIVISYYFEKKRGIATGISLCGTGGNISL